MEPLGDEDFHWIAERIHEHRVALAAHPRWHARLMDLIAVLAWPASVDSKEKGRIVKDGWIPSGQRLHKHHFTRAPHTSKALDALERCDLKAIKREHVVPRNTLRDILLQTPTISDSVRVIKAYSLIAFVAAEELPSIRPASRMPPAWGAGVNWAQSPLPEALPNTWERYSAASPRVVPKYHDGRPAF